MKSFSVTVPRKSMQLPNEKNVLTTLGKIEINGDKKEKKLMQTYFNTEDQNKINMRTKISKKTRQQVKNILE